MYLRKRQRTKEATSDDNASEGYREEMEGQLRSASKKSRISAKELRIKTNAPGTGSEEQDEEERALFEKLTQRLTNEMDADVINEPALYGTVLGVLLENFMCHSLLEMKFGPFMNFVVGQNGSGKSAVLTALTLCLGAKAAATSRGTNIRNFIKEGEHTAVIQVKLRNGGDGYKTDIYGDVIIVERSFNRDGGGGYKLKSKSKKTISTKKEELDEITDFMGLQIDNPMTILSQDMARQFLSNSTNEDKYKFFMKGVQLDQLKGDYDMLETASSNIDATLQSKNEDIKDLQNEAKDARRKVEALDKAKALDEILETFCKKHAWSQVAEMEKELQSHDQTVLQLREKLAKLHGKFDESTLEFESASRNAVDAKNAEQEAVGATNPLKDEEKEMKAAIDAGNASLLSEHQNEREVHQHVQDAERKTAKCRREIAVEQKRLEELDDGKNARIMQEKEAKSAELEQLKTVLSTLQAENMNGQKAKQDAKENLGNISSRVSAKRDDIGRCEGVIQNIQKSSSEIWAAYPPNMSRLVDAVERHSWVGDKPVGPFARHIRLIDTKWSLILERRIGANLNAFLCTTQDRMTLLRLMKQCHCEVPILTGRGSSLRELHEPPEEFVTVLRVLKIDNEDIKKALIISSYIEQTLLIDSHIQATKTMSDPPKNTKSCYALQNRKDWGFIVKGGQGSGSLTPIKPYNRMPRMTTDTTSQLKGARERLAELTQELQSLIREEKDAHDALRKIIANMDAFITRQSDTRRDIQRLEDDIERLTHSLEDSVPIGKLGNLEAQLEVHMNDKEHYENQYKEVIKSKDRTIDEQDKRKGELKDLKARIEEAQKLTDIYHKAVVQATRRREQALSDKNTYEDRIKLGVEEIEKSGDIRKAIEEKIVEITAQASEIYPERQELDPGEDRASIEKNITELNKALSKVKSIFGGDPGELARDYNQKQEKSLAAEREMKSLNDMLRVVKTTWRERVERWEYFKRHIVIRSRATFQLYMTEREYTGDLNFLHDIKQLVLNIQPSQQATDTKRGAKTLSGGEKSFSQICLLLALWEAMGSPFRCLDEFDVFMDAVNRGVSMTLIINAAQKSVGKQFILITPQDVSTKSIDSRNDVRIVRMKDPQRNQRRLNFPGNC